MKDNETISQYFKKIDSIVNTIIGLGGEIEDDEIVKKVLRTLPKAYKPKVSTLEDREKLGELTMDELYGILTAYELRLGIDNTSKGEATFKDTKKIKN